MYKKIIRPILFLLSPETIHRVTVLGLKILGRIPGGKALLRGACTVRHPSLEREVFGLKFPNPVGLAAGFDKNAEVYREISCLGFGFVEIGTVTPLPQPGNPKPRLFRLVKDRAIVNRMGFNNNGVEETVKRLRNRDRRIIIGGNLGKNTVTPNDTAPADYLRTFRRLYDHVDYFVINVSCPNVANLSELQEEKSLKEILVPVLEFRRGQSQYRPILLKISPDLTAGQIDNTIAVMKECKIDGIVATNTTVSRDGLKSERKTIRAIGRGGLSGAPLTERSIEMVRYIHEKTGGNFPIIGVGGIMSEEDAMAMLDAGACLIQLYTGFIYEGPKFAKRICKKIRLESEIREAIRS
ncbi:MAG: quinone-dependent dihydroorotate dehydrogenase [Rikenellaceae bacterium]|jgi:dihydroorotate dehydrogenase|nr:quinone-dependent dihydroorotate dehydrogenase [Rikenellaceae bacterium]